MIPSKDNRVHWMGLEETQPEIQWEQLIGDKDQVLFPVIWSSMLDRYLNNFELSHLGPDDEQECVITVRELLALVVLAAIRGVQCHDEDALYVPIHTTTILQTG